MINRKYINRNEVCKMIHKINKRAAVLEALTNTNEPVAEFFTIYNDNDARVRRYVMKKERFDHVMSEDACYYGYDGTPHLFDESMTFEDRVSLRLRDRYLKVYSAFDCSGEWFTTDDCVTVVGRYLVIDFIDYVDC